ncbi:MAG: DUF3267 domain-containing protein [Anaerolineae bacterium]|nr:DUF3267 domain-containing protein [Anaerolineae bacterium]
MAVYTELPAGYEQALYYPLTSRRLMVALNVAALVPLALAGAGMLAFLQAYQAAGAPFALHFLAGARLLPEGWDIVALIALLVVTFPLHELCHGIAFKLVGVARVRYGIIPKRLVLYAEPDGPAYLYRNDFIFCALAPLIFITVGGMALAMLLPGSVWLALVLAVMFNAGGAIGDIWTVMIILAKRFPPDALARDLGDTFVVYTLHGRER